jgi:hypothetical protein
MLILKEDGKREEKRRMMRSLCLVRQTRDGKAMLQLLRRIYVKGLQSIREDLTGCLLFLRPYNLMANPQLKARQVLLPAEAVAENERAQRQSGRSEAEAWRPRRMRWVCLRP